MSQTLAIELRDHPAQAEHPVTKKKLVDGDGKPISALPDWRSVWMLIDGFDTPDIMIGYVTPNKLFHLIKSERDLGGTVIVDRLRELVGIDIDTDGSGPIVPDLPTDKETDGEDDADE